MAAARAAQEAGTIYTLSTHSSCSIEEVAAGAPGPLWFQLYVWQNRDLTRSFVERARAAGYRALVLTVDVPVISRRERDLRNGFTIPPRITVRNVARHPPARGLDAPGAARPAAHAGQPGRRAGRAADRHRDARRRGQPPGRPVDRLGRPRVVPVALVGPARPEGRAHRRGRAARGRPRRRRPGRLEPRRPAARRDARVGRGAARDRGRRRRPGRGPARRRRPARGGRGARPRARRAGRDGRPPVPLRARGRGARPASGGRSRSSRARSTTRSRSSACRGSATSTGPIVRRADEP